MAGNTPETSAQVLVVEDETEIRELISLLLLRQGHRVQQCASAIEALEKLKTNKYDLMILDWMLPHMSGLDLLKNLGTDKTNKVPVLMVTAKAEPDDIVQGLEAGADDYVTKPFEPAIFSARVKALLRRASTGSENVSGKGNIAIGPLTLNTETYEVRLHSELVHLTPSEFKILATLAASQGKVLTRDHLVSVVQGEGISVTGRTIDTHVFGLRKKMGEASDWIETIRGVGYRVKQNDRT
jgi:DNA-binding response OmpR family regulator